ncbi:MAG: hypothetical protein AAGE61_10910 [Pseudomonadota bacterium]
MTIRLSLAALLAVMAAAAALALLSAAQVTADSGRTDNFTIRAGALVEAIYLNNNGVADDLANLEAAINAAGGEHLTNLEVIRNESENHPITHVVFLQWSDPSRRSALTGSAAWDVIDDHITDLGFFGVRGDTSVELHEDRIYDATHAWTIAKSPEQMQVVMQVIGRYFQAITPVLKEYKIATKAFFGPAPGVSDPNFPTYSPQIFGLFEWQSLEDVEKFRSDERWLKSVDIRDATFERDEDTYFTRVMF